MQNELIKLFFLRHALNENVFLFVCKSLIITIWAPSKCKSISILAALCYILGAEWNKFSNISSFVFILRCAEWNKSLNISSFVFILRCARFWVRNKTNFRISPHLCSFCAELDSGSRLKQILEYLFILYPFCAVLDSGCGMRQILEYLICVHSVLC